MSHGSVELQCQIMSYINKLWRGGLPPPCRVVLTLAVLCVSEWLIPLRWLLLPVCLVTAAGLSFSIVVTSGGAICCSDAILKVHGSAVLVLHSAPIGLVDGYA